MAAITVVSPVARATVPIQFMFWGFVDPNVARIDLTEIRDLSAQDPLPLANLGNFVQQMGGLVQLVANGPKYWVFFIKGLPGPVNPDVTREYRLKLEAFDLNNVWQTSVRHIVAITNSLVPFRLIVTNLNEDGASGDYET